MKKSDYLAGKRAGDVEHAEGYGVDADVYQWGTPPVCRNAGELYRLICNYQSMDDCWDRIESTAVPETMLNLSKDMIDAFEDISNLLKNCILDGCKPVCPDGLCWRQYVLSYIFVDV